MRQVWIILIAAGCMACSLTIDLRRQPKLPQPTASVTPPLIINSGSAGGITTFTAPGLMLTPPDPDNEPLVPGDPPFINLCRPGCLMPGVKVI
jgi:hypothetical protein